MDGRPYEVVGVGKPIGTVLGQTQDNFVYIPIETWMKFYATSTTSLASTCKRAAADWMARTQEEAQMLMRARRHLNPNDLDNFGILDGGSLVDLFKRITGALAGLDGRNRRGIPGDRRRGDHERDAGDGDRAHARNRPAQIPGRAPLAIFSLQFLTETAVMSTIGGAIGVALAYVFAGDRGANTPVPMHVPISAVIIALRVSTAVGVFFGLYPANKAANLSPIEALRQEI